MHKIVKKPVRSRFWQVFAVPAIIAVGSSAGLLSALIGDGLFDALSWITLGAPVALICWYTTRPGN
jgi:hypothetical protein